MAKRRRYTDEERASYVAMLELAGYQADGTNAKVLQELSRKSGIHQRTLRRWFKRSQNPPPDNLVADKKVDLVTALNQELGQIFVQMEYAREDANYKELATAAGIFIDKMQLISGKPTERTEHVESTDARERLAHLANRHAERSRAKRDSELTH